MSFRVPFQPKPFHDSMILDSMNGWKHLLLSLPEKKYWGKQSIVLSEQGISDVLM